MNKSKTELLQFIQDYELKRADGIIAFDATVSFYHNDELRRIPSMVQVVNLPKEMVIYIHEFMKDEYHQSEVFSTELFSISYSEGTPLEIRTNSNHPGFIISILPDNRKRL
ncbi:MAG: hypothetical protein QM791_10885 [Ferruginibacter sp.]